MELLADGDAVEGEGGLPPAPPKEGGFKLNRVFCDIFAVLSLYYNIGVIVCLFLKIGGVCNLRRLVSICDVRVTPPLEGQGGGLKSYLLPLHDTHIDGRLGAYTHFAEDVCCLGCGEPPVVLGAWGDDESAHVYCARADEVLPLTLGMVAVGAVGTAWDDQQVHSVLLAIGHHVHVGLIFSLGDGELCI